MVGLRTSEGPHGSFFYLSKSLICLSRMLNGVALCMCYRTFVSAAQEALSSTPGLPPGSGGDWDTDLCSLMETKLFLGHTGECGVGGCVRVSLLFQKLKLAELNLRVPLPEYLEAFLLCIYLF